MVFKKVLDVQEKIKSEKENLRDIEYWTSFLKTASMQYKHTFNDQIAIHEAAPDSIACADAQIWRKNYCTFVDSPEAILTEKDGKLHRLFDISQVQGDFTETYWIWKIDDDELNRNYSDIVNRKLCDKYNIYNETLEETIYELSLSKTAQRINVSGDMYNIVSESAAYMVIHRCCPDSAELSPEKVRTALANIPIDEIGQAVMTVARDLFSEIEGIVKAERTAEIDRRNLDEYNRGINDKGNEMHLQSGEQTVLSDNQNNSRENLHTGRGDVSLLSDSKQEIEPEQDNAAGTSELSESNERNGKTQRGDSVLNNSPMANENDDTQIIGNINFKYIPRKSYRKFDTEKALKIAELLEKNNIKYSAKITGKTTTITVSKENLEGLHEISESIKEDPTDKAIRLINEYCEKEFESKANFSNMDHVDLAYTTEENTELSIEVYADLETFRIVKEYDKLVVSEELFDSLDDMCVRLANLEFDDLIFLTDSEKSMIKSDIESVEKIEEFEDLSESSEDNSPLANENISQEDSEQLLYPVIKPELAADEWTAITTEFFSYETAWHNVEQRISEIAESYRKGEDITEKLGKYFNINNSENHDIEKFSDKLIITHKETGFSKEYTWSEIGIIQLQMLKDRFKEDTLDAIRWYPETADKYNALIERMEKEDYPERNSPEPLNTQSDTLTKNCYDLENYTVSVNGVYDIPLILNDEQRKRFEQFGLISADDKKEIYFSTNGNNWNAFQIRDGNSWNSVNTNVILSKSEISDLESIVSELIERNSDEQILNLSSESPENNSPLANENTNIDTNKLLTETIMHGSGFQDGKFRIDEFYREHTPSTNEFASFLKKEYGIGGHSGTDNIIMISYGNSGLEIKYNENNEQKITLFNWNQVAKKTAEIIDNGNYITDKDIADRIKYAEYILKNVKEDGSHRREYAEKVLKQYNVPIPESSIKNIPVGMTSVNADMTIGMIENGFTVTDRNSNILSENSVIENAMEYLVSTSDFEHQTDINTVALAIADISSRFEYMETMLGEPYILDLMRFADSHDWDFKIEKNVYENTVKLLREGNIEPIENYLNCAVKELVNLDNYETEYKMALSTIEHLSDYSQKYISDEIIQEELIEKVEIDSLPTENQFANGESENNAEKIEESKDTAISSEAEEKNSPMANEASEKTFEQQVNDVLENRMPFYSSLKVCDTPQILLDCGLEQLPMLYTQKHLKDAIKPIDKKEHHHGLSIEQIKKLPELIEKPLMVMDSLNRNDSIIIVTSEYDTANNPIVISVKPNGSGKYELEQMDSNFITSVYGRNNFQNFFERIVNSNNLLYCNKEKSLTVFERWGEQYSELTNTISFDTIIHKSNNIVNRNAKKFANDAVDYHIETDNIEIGGEKAKFRANIAAIETLKIIEAQHRNATPEEQEIMSKYTGWGGLQNAFDSRKSEWSKEYSELKELLTDEEYNSAKASVLDAFYTPPFIIESIYNALNKMGFKNGNILEPSCGIGNFLGKIPENMYQNSHISAIEKDSISGRIAKLLYPNADISICGFEEKDFADNSFDAAIGNIPFGSFKISDKRYNKNNFMIHDYFFAKTLDKVRPGGIVAFVTSKGTLDKANPEVRRYIAQRAELIGAVRLPNNAFKSYAGTEVTSDIIFLQKREEKTNVMPDWIYTDLDSNGFSMNSYFTEHPDMILGQTVEGNKLYGRKGSMVVSFENADLKNLLSTAIMKIKAEYKEADLKSTQQSKDKTKTVITADPDVRNYSYTEINGEIYYRTDSIMTKQDFGAKKIERVSGMIKISEYVHKLLDMQLEGYSENAIQSMRDQLNQIYNNFTTKNGYLNDKANANLFSNDVSAQLLLSLETIKDGELVDKAAIFTRTTLKPPENITHVDTAADALIVSISEKACVDMPFMEQLTGKSEQEIFSELKGVIFLNPLHNPENITEPKYFTANEYLSGNIRNKLEIAKNAEKISSDYSINVSALEKAMPEPLEAGEITAQLGSAWIDTKYIEQFIREELKIKDIYPKIIVNHNAYTASWHVENKTELSINNKIKTTEEYGTTRKSALEIIQSSLNQRDVTVYDIVYNSDKGKEERVINHDETLLARQKQKILEQDFKEWIFKDPDRRNALVEKYNVLYNSTRQREYDGSHLTFSGMNTEITLRKHQKDAVAHALYGGNTLFAHKVGAGKSFEMIAAAMEGKRLGLHNKSLIAVPNHMTRQFANDFLELYPNANILVAEEKDFTKNNRQKLCAKIATGEFDAVIIGHSQLIKIPVSKEREEKFIDNEITEITNQIANIKAANGDNFTIKDMERVKKSLESRLDKLLKSTTRDNVVTFEELGVDKLIVDEADMFKNLYINTKMRNLSGISTNESVQKTQDLYMKCQYINEITNGKGIIFATGTPISNSISEVYIMQKYLNPKGLEEAGVSHFDAWAANFAQKVTKLEFAPSGNGFVQKTRLAKFNNIPELMTMFKEFTDIKTAEDLNLPEPECERHTIAVEATPVQKKLMQALGERADRIHKKTVTPDVDNMLNITTDGTKIGLDQRLINPDLPDDPNSKVNACINNVFDIYNKTSENRLTQAIFCDYSTPKYDGSFSIYEDIKAKLIEKGVPENEIAFIHDCKNNKQKESLFAKVRSGDVRIILGSTQKMGAGTNIQDKLVALHHLDPTWKPRDMEQRLGRMKRQGNENKTVHEYIYVTKDTFDANRFQTLETKQGYISQIMTNHNPLRSCEDVSLEEISFAEVKAACVGNPLIKEKMELDIDISQLQSLKSSYLKSHYRLEDTIRKIPDTIAEKTQLHNNALKDIETAKLYPPKLNDDGSAVFQGIIINGTKYTDRAEAGEALLSFTGKALIQNDYNSVEIGEYRGFKLSVLFDVLSKEMKLDIIGNNSYRISLGSSELGNLTRIENAINHIPDRAEEYMSEIKSLENQLAEAKTEYAKPFPQEQELQDKLKRLDVVEQELNKQNDDVMIEDKGKKDLEEKNNAEQEQQREQSQNTHRSDDIVSL